MLLQNGNIKIQKYQFNPHDVIGQGASGNIYKGHRINDGHRVAIKAINMKLITNQVTKYLLQGQKTAMATVKSPYVIQAFDVIQTKDYCYIVIELCSGGTLKDYIQKKGKLGQKQSLDFFRKILAGYIAINQAKIIHRDLKTANIMLRQNNQPAIIDFGFCQMILGKRPLAQYNVGSPSYMSPQAYLKSMYSQKSDIWALGVILHQMLTGQLLDQSVQSAKYFNMLKNSKIALYNQNLFSPLVKQIFDKVFLIHPLQRATSLKVKYILDKNMIGKFMPLQQKEKFISFPSRLKKMKSLNIQFSNANNLQSSILKKQSSEMVKPKLMIKVENSQSDSPLKLNQNNKTHNIFFPNRPLHNTDKAINNKKITFGLTQSVSRVYAFKKQTENQIDDKVFQDQIHVIKKKSQEEDSLTDSQTKNNINSNVNYNNSFQKSNSNEQNEAMSPHKRIKFQIMGLTPQQKLQYKQIQIVNNAQQVESPMLIKRISTPIRQITPINDLRPIIKVEKINSQKRLNIIVNNINLMTTNLMKINQNSLNLNLNYSNKNL